MKLNKSKFEIKDGKHIFSKLSTFYDKNDIENWSKKACEDINDIFEKYQVSDFKVNEKSYMGIVMDCKSNVHNEFFIKVVPPVLERFEKEVGTLKLLPSQLTCRLFEVDKEKTTIVMEKIVPGKLVEFYNNKDALNKMFNELNQHKIEIDKYVDENFRDFSEIVEKDYLISKKIKHIYTYQVERLYNEFLKSYNEICSTSKKYLLHGDIYKNNMLLSESGIKLIDPLGFKAPFVMELVSICAYNIFYNDTNKSSKEVLNDFIVFFKEFVDEDTYKEAVFCQLVKVFIPSIYEANDGGNRANKWLEIIKELYPSKI